MLGDLRNPRWLILKAALFVLLGCMAGGLLVADVPTVRTIVLLLLTVWAFARAYFFLFCVIENYIDSTFRYAGLHSALVYIVRSRWTPAEHGHQETPQKSPVLSDSVK